MKEEEPTSKYSLLVSEYIKHQNEVRKGKKLLIMRASRKKKYKDKFIMMDVDDEDHAISVLEKGHKMGVKYSKVMIAVSLCGVRVETFYLDDSQLFFLNMHGAEKLFYN